MASPISEEVLRDGMDRKQELLLSLRKAEPITIADLLANRRHHDVPGVYAISTPADDEIVYVGRTKIKSIAGRIADHRTGNGTSDLREKLRHNAHMPQALEQYFVRYVRVTEPRPRLFFEHFAIGCLAPRLNG